MWTWEVEGERETETERTEDIIYIHMYICLLKSLIGREIRIGKLKKTLERERENNEIKEKARERWT